MRKLMGILLTVVMLLSCAFLLPACINDDNKKDEGDYVEGVTLDGDRVYYGDSTSGKTRIKFSFSENGYGRLWIENIAKYFVKENQEYWILLDGDPNLTGGIVTKMESQRNLSDVFAPLSSSWELFAVKDYIVPITDVYNSKPDGEDRATLGEKLSGEWKRYGHLKTSTLDDFFILPWNENVTGIVYNAGMFEQYGWEVPVTMNDMLALCAQIKKDTNSKIMPFVFPGLVGGYFGIAGYTWWMQQSGVEGLRTFFDFESAEVFNPAKEPSKGRLAALDTFKTLFGPNVDFSVTGSMSKNHITAQMDFLRGNAAMIINASWMESEMRNSFPAGFRMKMMNVPFLETARKDENGEYKYYNFGATPDYMFIPKGAPNVEGAKKLLSFMCRDDMLRLYTKYAGALRPFDYSTEDLEVSEFVQSCIDLWAKSERFFVSSKNASYVGGKIPTDGGYPDLYNGIAYGDISNPKSVLNSIYLMATENWSTWTAGGGIIS